MPMPWRAASREFLNTTFFPVSYTHLIGAVGGHPFFCGGLEQEEDGGQGENGAAQSQNQISAAPPHGGDQLGGEQVAEDPGGAAAGHDQPQGKARSFFEPHVDDDGQRDVQRKGGTDPREEAGEIKPPDGVIAAHEGHAHKLEQLSLIHI